MGGNIFKEYLSTKQDGHVLKRLDTDCYSSALSTLHALLTSLGLTFKDIDYVREKDSHGDIDILIELTEEELVTKVHNQLVELNFQTERNNSILSFLMFTFQVDLIFVNRDYIDYAKHYFSWNDLGNLVGRMSKRLNLKHGFDGLYYELKEGFQVLYTQKISTNYYDILRILELDIKHFDKGFNTYEEMFQWLSNSPYFNPDIYSFDNLNHRNRVRDRKRKVYTLFLEWVSKNTFKPFDDSLLTTVGPTSIIKLFPDLPQQIGRELVRLKEQKLLSEKFNGRLVMELTPLTGKQLGDFISKFKLTYNSKTLLESSATEMKTLILDFYKDVYLHEVSNFSI